MTSDCAGSLFYKVARSTENKVANKISSSVLRNRNFKGTNESDHLYKSSFQTNNLNSLNELD